MAQQPHDKIPPLHLSIEQIWEQAALNNKRIAMSRLSLESSEEALKDAKAERLPEINATGAYARVTNMPVYEDGIFHTPEQFPVLHNYYKVGGEAYFNIYNGNRTNLEIKKEATEHAIAEQQKNLTVSEVKFRAAVCYLDLVRSCRFKELIAKDIADQERQLAHIRELQKNGVVLKSDVLRATLKLSRQKVGMVEIDNDIAIASQQLAIMIGADEHALIVPDTSFADELVVPGTYDDYIATAAEHAYEYKISEGETALKELSLKQVKANVSPKVGLFAEYAWSYPEIQFYPYANATYGLGMYGVKAAFPISSFYLGFRFIQGMANCVSTSVCLTLVFSRLRTDRAREIGYSLFYGALLCITAFTTLVTAPIIDAFDYNVLYKWMMFMYVPGAVLLVLIMNRIRLNRKLPLYQLDWASYVIYTTALCLIGYILLYGQQYYWFSDERIVTAAIVLVILGVLHYFRQRALKRPYLSLHVFRYRNYLIGVFLLVILYICRGAFNITTNYFTTVLGMDPRHLSYILLANIGGIVGGVLYSSRWIVMKRPMRWIWMAGFAFLLVFHLWMNFLFASEADASSFIAPLIIQGIGAGMLMAPIIVYAISSVPAHLGGTASATGVLFRFTGFCTSIALINYFQLYSRKVHYNRFLDLVTSLDPFVTARLEGYKTAVIAKGVPADQAAKMAGGLLYRSADIQAQIRFSMDYYYLISCLLIVVILLIALLPYLNRTVINLRNNQPAPAVY